MRSAATFPGSVSRTRVEIRIASSGAFTERKAEARSRPEGTANSGDFADFSSGQTARLA
jgi:hypothetical protein